MAKSLGLSFSTKSGESCMKVGRQQVGISPETRHRVADWAKKVQHVYLFLQFCQNIIQQELFMLQMWSYLSYLPLEVILINVLPFLINLGDPSGISPDSCHIYELFFFCLQFQIAPTQALFNVLFTISSCPGSFINTLGQSAGELVPLLDHWAILHTPLLMVIDHDLDNHKKL